MNKKRKPHIHAEVIKAWADGYKIEVQDSIGDWIIREHPNFLPAYKYRIYDPLREVKEAFERGETVQYQEIGDNRWIDLYKKAKNISWDTTNFKWRVKPKDEFKVGDWVINTLTLKVYKIKEKKDGYLKFIENGFFISVSDKEYRIATKQEVLNATNYNGTATNKNFPFEKGDWIIQDNDYYVYEIDTDGRADVLNNCDSWYYATKQEIKEYLLKETLKYKEEFKIGDWIIVIIGNSQYDVGNVHKITDISKHNVIFVDGNAIGEYCIRKATKKEVLNAPNYDGTATNEDFPFEVKDRVICRKVENPEVLYVDQIIKNSNYFIVTPDDFGYGAGRQVDKRNFNYATKKEIESSYIPFTWEDREQLRGKWVKHKKCGSEFLISGFDKILSHCFVGSRPLTFQILLNSFVFLDGTPCGKLK